MNQTNALSILDNKLAEGAQKGCNIAMKVVMLNTTATLKKSWASSLPMKRNS